jgi:hypothetical protein
LLFASPSTFAVKSVAKRAAFYLLTVFNFYARFTVLKVVIVIPMFATLLTAYEVSNHVLYAVLSVVESR